MQTIAVCNLLVRCLSTLLLYYSIDNSLILITLNARRVWASPPHATLQTSHTPRPPWLSERAERKTQSFRFEYAFQAMHNSFHFCFCLFICSFICLFVSLINLCIWSHTWACIGIASLGLWVTPLTINTTFSWGRVSARSQAFFSSTATGDTTAAPDSPIWPAALD